MKKYGWLIDKIDLYTLLSTAENVYGPYNRSDGRQHVIVVREDGSRSTVSLPKYIMEAYLGHKLDPQSTVDHWDTDKNNNSIENLRIVPRDIHSADDTRRVKLLDLKCSVCNKMFKRSPRLVRDKSKKGKVSQFCSRQCAGKYSRDVQLGLRDKLPVQPPPASEYYKRKYIEKFDSLIDNFINKYAKDYDEVDPETGTAKPIDFEAGDLVRDFESGKLAKYISTAYWKDPNMAIVQFVDRYTKFEGKPRFSYVKKSDLDLVEKKV